MALVIELTPEIETRLRAKASLRGLTPDAYARDVLKRDTEQLEEQSDVAAIVLSPDKATRHAQIRALLHAPSTVREATFRAGAQALADDYENDPELTEMTRALQDEPFLDD